MKLINIIVAGPQGCGKTTFLEAASEIPPILFNKVFSSGDPCHFLELGRISVEEDIFLYLIGTPLEARSQPIWDRAGDNLAGFILIVDAENKTADVLNEVAKVIELVSDIPFLVVANRLEDSPATVKKMRAALKLNQDHSLIAVDVRQKSSVKKVIFELLSESHRIAERKSA